jgi:Putative beta-barrel porin 2
MKTLLRFAVPFAVLPTLALAVYAPIPEQEQGKAFTYRLGASVYHDSNIFGAASGEISSAVYNLTGSISYNGSVDPQTFLSASYEISNDYVVDRPGEKNLTSHTFDARLAHQFSEASNIDVSGDYSISKNPESLLNGIPVNTDQSFKRAQLDGKYTTAFGQKGGAVVKYRYLDYSYDNAALQTTLDRNESLAGLELSYALLPETKLVGEYRYQTINYSTGSASKDKTSNFLMGGVDYNPGEKLMVSGRLGFEDRHRDGSNNTTAPYLELSTRYTYADGSFLAAGYNYTLEESSDPVRFNDTKVSRFFVNVQHRLSGTITASGSIDFEPSVLQGRGAQPNLNETTTRFGLGLTWLPTKNWAISGTYDLDDVNSDDPTRGQNRDRFGVSARYTF